MVEEGLLGRLVCLSWSHDSRLRNLIGITLKAIYDRYDVRHCRSAPPLMRRRLTLSLSRLLMVDRQATIGKSISIVPTLEQIAIHTVQVLLQPSRWLWFALGSLTPHTDSTTVTCAG